MENTHLPLFPMDLGFKFDSYSVTEMASLFRCCERTIYRHMKKIRPYMGRRTSKKYPAEYVMILSMVWDTPKDIYNFIIWLEQSGWKEYLIDKYKLQPLFPEMRNATS